MATEKQEPNWWVYVLECEDGTLYTGSALDPEKRLAVHNSGKGSKYVRSRLPARLLISWRYPNKGAALRAEAAFKNLSRAQKRDALHEGTPPKVIDASRNSGLQGPR